MARVTTRSGKQRALIAHEIELCTILDTIPDPLIVVDAQGGIRAFSRTAEELLAYSATAVAGGDIAYVLPDGWTAIRHTATMANPRVVKAVRADGSGVTVELRIGGPAPCGDVQLFVLLLRDVSQQLARAERLDILRSDLADSSRATAIGEFAAHLTHELSQPLAAIVNFISAARELARRGEAATAIEDMLEIAAGQAVRAGDILQRMLAVATRREVAMHTVAVAAEVDDAVALTVGCAQDRPLVVRRLDPAAPAMTVDPTQINQVLTNLLHNALQALREGTNTASGTITIASQRRGPDRIEISIADDGPGIAEAILPHLFDPFRSTKGSEGMGLGLSICRSIVERHGGHITGENVPGGGACFRFTVPSAIPGERAAGG